MKVLMISSDRKVFEGESAVSLRMKDYGELVEELHIVVLCAKSQGFKPTQLGKNTWAYPANASFKLSRPFAAASLGKRLAFEKKFVRGESVITSQDPFECGYAAMKIKNKWRLPLEVQLHTDPFSPYFSGFKNRVRKMIARKVLSKADAIRCVSEAVAQKVGELAELKNKTFVLPISVDKEAIENGPISFDLHARYGWRFVLLSVSRLEKEKNLGVAIRALARVRERYPETGLVIVGSGSEGNRLKNLAQKLGQSAHVEFAGWQSELSSFYKTANVFLQTSLFEGYGLSLVEAGISGTPIVTTPVGIAKELENGKDAYICGFNDEATFSNAIIDLIENNFKRDNLKTNLKKTLEAKLISKEEYLKSLRENWEREARLVR
jgi:glycosyltransferase involved in cell wall biosynthesis